MNMNEIVCPHCQKAFKVDESGYAEILKQVHDKDFEKQLAERISALKDVNTIATELAVTNAKSALENERNLLQSELKSAQTAHQLPCERNRCCYPGLVATNCFQSV